jgi:phosphoglycolate phosphatase
MDRAVLFDVDFTLADSSAGIVECVQFAMHRLPLDVAEIEAVRRTVGLSLSDSFVALTGRDDPALLDAFSKPFIEHTDRLNDSAGLPSP